MNTSKWTFAILLTTACTLPAAAQTVKPDSILSKKVEVAVQREAASSELTEQEKIAAEEELQHIRSVQDSNATFAKYPYLLDPAYRRGLIKPKGPEQQPAVSKPDVAAPDLAKPMLPKKPASQTDKAKKFISFGRLAQQSSAKQDTTSLPKQLPRRKMEQRPAGYHSPNSIWAKKVGI